MCNSDFQGVLYWCENSRSPTAASPSARKSALREPPLAVVESAGLPLRLSAIRPQQRAVVYTCYGRHIDFSCDHKLRWCLRVAQTGMDTVYRQVRSETGMDLKKAGQPAHCSGVSLCTRVVFICCYCRQLDSTTLLLGEA